MPRYFAIFALCVMISLVLFRARQMKRHGIQAFLFGKFDRKDFFIPPFVLLFLYLILANTFGLPKFGKIMDVNPLSTWVGAACCSFAPVLFLWGILSFGNSFRVGIDLDQPGPLVCTGAFSISRNPLYLAFFLILCGIFLIFPTWVFFASFIGGLWLIDRQVCAEENALRDLYGKEYDEYCKRVRRYI